MARSKASDYHMSVQFYKKGKPVRDPSSGRLVAGEPVPYKKIWCKEESVFREQLVQHLEGLKINRNRKQLTCRYRTDIDSTMYFKLGNDMYGIDLYGDKKGDRRELFILAEVAKDGGS